jgi:hypothetical protein
MGLPGWGDISGSVLLVWHEKVSNFILSKCRETLEKKNNTSLSSFLSLQLTEVAGVECFAQAMTDRRIV